MRRRTLRFEHDVDYSVRSVAVIRKHGEANTPAFEVVCYGMSHSELCTVAVPKSEDIPDRFNPGGGQRLLRALERRGIDTAVWRPNIFETYEPSDKFREG